jgi:O-antigen/teichoic acid export membrane protein
LIAVRGARSARWVTAGLADQFVMACANAGNTVLALVLLKREPAGIMILALTLAYVVMYLNRAFVGDVLLALASRYDGTRRDRLVRNGLAAAVGIGAIAAVVLLVLWAVWPRDGKIDLRDLVWVAPFLPVILLHDTGRCSYLADRQPAKALVIDLVWVGTQAVAVAVMLFAGVRTAGGLFICWGLGAAAGATVFLLRSGQRPWRGKPLQWVAETRHLSGWFTATALIGQFQVVAISFIVSGQLSQRDLSGLRGAQTALINPVQNFLMAVQSLVVPRASRLARDAGGLADDDREQAAASLRRLTRLLALAFAGLAVVMIAVMWPLAELVLVRIPKFADIAPLALPMSLQAGIYLVQLPFTAALRAMHRARALLLQYVVFTAVSLTGLVIGARTAALEGAAWGLTIGAAAGLVAMVGLYWYSLRFLGQVEPDGFEDAEEAAIVPTDDAIPA